MSRKHANYSPDLARQSLAQMAGSHRTFSAHFIRTGTKVIKTEGMPDVTLPTYLFRGVTHNGRRVAEHVWINSCPGIRRAKLVAGDIVTFEAQVTPYIKTRYGKGGSVSVAKDYALSDVRNMKQTGRLSNFIPQEDFIKKYNNENRNRPIKDTFKEDPAKRSA